MPTKIRNIVFIIICICALSIAFIYQGAKWVHVLPASFNNGTYSYLEGAKLQTRPKVSLENIKKGTFQSQTEKWITTKVPKRDSVMLTNAKVQRSMIKIANLPTKFETIPTYFGSGYSVTEALGSIAPNSTQQSNDTSQSYEKSALAINNFMNAYSNLNYTISIPDRVDTSEANPSYSLTSLPIDQEYRNTHFLSKLNARINYVNLCYSNADEYYKKYFKTDHHWDILGAYDAYQKIMEKAFPNLPALTMGEENLVTYQEPVFYGTGARNAMCIPAKGDLIQDYITDLSDVEITINNKHVNSEGVEHIEKYSNKTFDVNTLMDRHAEYFTTNSAVSTFERANGTNRRLLIIKDSYSSSCTRFYAFTFDKIVAVDQEKFNGSLKTLIEENSITDVLFMQSDSRYNKEEEVRLLIKMLES